MPHFRSRILPHIPPDIPRHERDYAQHIKSLRTRTAKRSNTTQRRARCILQLIRELGRRRRPKRRGKSEVRFSEVKLKVTPQSASGNIGELSGVCPHCERSVIFRAIPNGPQDFAIPPEKWLGQRMCPDNSCAGHIFFVSLNRTIVVTYPARTEAKRSLPAGVPAAYQAEFDEAVSVLAASPKASAALSRRLLQRILREHLGIKKPDLAQEIQALLDSKALPSYLSEAIDAVRNIGNFAAHPLKSTSSGQIVDVEPGEAEWNLDVLELLCDFYFVRPAAAQLRKDALNQKLKDLGKPALK